MGQLPGNVSEKGQNITNIPDLLDNIINHFPAAIFEWQCNKMWQNHRKLPNMSFWHLTLPVKFWQTFGISLLHIPSHPQMNTHDCRYWIEISKWILRLLREWQYYKKIWLNLRSSLWTVTVSLFLDKSLEFSLSIYRQVQPFNSPSHKWLHIMVNCDREISK